MKSIQHFIRIQLRYLLIFPFIRLMEYLFLSNKLDLAENFKYEEFTGLLYDVQFWVIYSLILLPIFFLIALKHGSLAVKVQKGINAISIMSMGSLLIYFSQRGSALDQEIILQSFSESLMVVENSNAFELINIFILLGPVLLYFLIDYIFSRIPKIGVKLLSVFLVTLFTIALSLNSLASKELKTYQLKYQLRSNKIAFLVSQIFKYQFSQDDSQLNKKDILQYQKYMGFDFVSTKYPLLHKNRKKDVLGKYLNKADSPPNIVYIIVESLSSTMSGAASDYKGMFTPFFDSLSSQSLYWPNCLSSSAISFEILPTLAASAPYGKTGFNMIPILPHHQSIVKILNKQDYYSAFITGLPLSSANQGAFMRAQNTEFIINKFDSKYSTIDNGDKWSWGYSDDALFRQGLDLVDSLFEPPYINFYITITTHPPYIFKNSDVYRENYRKMLDKHELSPKERDFFIKNSKMLASFKSFDDELKYFLESYKKRPEYKNTIFIITGDHQGYYKPKNAANHFRVPLVIFSPLIKKPEQFNAVVLHAQVAPSLLSCLSNNYNIKVPSLLNFLTEELDTNREFRNVNTYPFIYWNKEILDLIHDDYYLHGEDLYKLKGPYLDLDSLDNDSIKTLMTKLLNDFKLINTYVCFQDRLIPDSLYESTILCDSLVYDYQDTTFGETKSMFPFGTRYTLSRDIEKLKFDISFDLVIPEVNMDYRPQLIISIEKPNQDNYKEFYDSKLLSFLTGEDIVEGKRIHYYINDFLDLKKFNIDSNTIVKIYLYNSRELDINYSRFKVKLYE